MTDKELDQMNMVDKVIESLQDEYVAELSEYMKKFEDCSLNDILITLEANMEAYYG